jgi:hypothetical protein
MFITISSSHGSSRCALFHLHLLLTTNLLLLFPLRFDFPIAAALAQSLTYGSKISKKSVG